MVLDRLYYDNINGKETLILSSEKDFYLKINWRATFIFCQKEPAVIILF